MTPNLTGLYIIGAAALLILLILVWPEGCRCNCKKCCKDE